VGSVLENLPRESRVAILRLRSLGDCVLTTPALDILRRARPDLRVAVVVEDRFRAIFEDNSDVDEILPPEPLVVRRFQPRLCVNFHGGNRSAWMTAVSGARYRAGFGHFRHRLVYNLHIPRAQEILGVERTVHTAEHLASAMFWLGAPVATVPRAQLVSRATGPVRPLAVIHPVGATPEKTWRADGFLEVAVHLRQSGLDVVVIGAETDDLSPFAGFRVLHGRPLSEIKDVLATATLFVGNDSGPAHMAAAFGLPVVAIFGESDPAIWGPWQTASEVIRAHGGIRNVVASQVIAATARLRVNA
jgi:ADP-heptose:LPS heptosyltransferase